MSEIFDKAIVEKRNVLNELRANNLSLQELRFFSIYLSSPPFLYLPIFDSYVKWAIY